MGMRMDPQALAQALARRSKAPSMDGPLGMDTSMAPGSPSPVEKPNMDINLEPSGEIQLPPGQKMMLPDGDNLMAQLPIDLPPELPAPVPIEPMAPAPMMPDALGMDNLSDSDKELLMSGRPGSLTGKVRKAMLMAKNGSQA